MRSFLDEAGATYERLDDDNALCERVAELLASENVVGWMQGRMEFGPRALGSRSILGDARSTAMQQTMNLKIKFRESFRPFAPSIMQEAASEYFEMEPGQESPYMLLVADVREEKRHSLSEEQATVQGLDQLGVVRSTVPAITHVDYSARVQTVDPVRHPLYHQLLAAFQEKTGSPVLINTSFNIRGEPIVCSPQDAWNCFLGTNMDVLVIGRHIMVKDAQPESLRRQNDDYLASFELD